jgi:hypothetical protein
MTKEEKKDRADELLYISRSGDLGSEDHTELEKILGEFSKNDRQEVLM